MLQVQGPGTEEADQDGRPLSRDLPGHRNSPEQRGLCQGVQLPQGLKNEPREKMLCLVIQFTYRCCVVLDNYDVTMAV